MRILFFAALILITLALFSFFRKRTTTKPTTLIRTCINPYKDSSANLIYNLLFCDNLDLYKESTTQPYKYPFSILFDQSSTTDQLQKIIADSEADPRIKILAYNQLHSRGEKSEKKELLAVIVEVGLDNGLDVLASFNNGTARYINQAGGMLIWETTTDDTGNKLTHDLFNNSQIIVDKIGPWNKPRKQQPAKDMARITFLMSDGLYFGEGPVNDLFRDSLAGPALASATQLMTYLTGKGTQSHK